MRPALALLATSLALAPLSAQAHSLWINAHESHAHQPPHAMVSLGWGHSLPADDILNSPNGRVIVDRFAMVDPTGQQTELLMPATELAEPAMETPNFALFAADLASQKIAFTADSAEGVYQFEAVSRPTFYTQYMDTEGRQRLALKPRDEIDGIDKVLMSVKYQAFAKSAVTVGTWSNPAPLGHDLEIIPRTDLSDVHVGDLIEVDVLFHGEPLTVSAKSMEFITAQSAGFGQNDGFALFSVIKNGRAQFRVQTTGQWRIMVSHKDDVTPEGPLSDLVGKANQVYHGASLTFSVQ